MLSVMEPMNVTLISVIKREGNVRARARAVAQDARLNLEVTFEAGLHSSREDLWRQARDEVLRYLDIA